MKGEKLRELLRRLIIVLIGGYVFKFEIFGFEHLITLETADVIDSFSSRQNLGTAVGTHARITLFYALPNACQELYIPHFGVIRGEKVGVAAASMLSAGVKPTNTGMVVKAPAGVARSPSAAIDPPVGVTNSTVPRLPAVAG